MTPPPAVGGSRGPLLALVLAGALTLGACGDTDTDTGGPGPSTTSTPACPTFGSTAVQEGTSTVTRSPAIALLRNVQVQASACVDEVAYLFLGGRPGWRVAYEDGQITEDPSGRPVAVAGRAHVVVTFQPAAGVDLAAPEPITTYEGALALQPSTPSDVPEVRRIGDFEAVTTWAIGLSSRRSFEVVARGDQLVVRIAAPRPRDTRCELGARGVTVGYPPTWYADLGGDRPCRYFASEPFPVHPGTDASDWSVTVDEADVSAAEVVDRVVSGPADVALAEVEVGGTPATRIEAVETGDGMLPAGYAYRMYVLDAGSRAVTVFGSPAPPGARLDANRAAADALAQLVRTPPST